MNEELINDILNYLEYLKEHHKLYITIHSAMNVSEVFMYRFTPYNIHCNPYCLAIKSNHNAWDKCISCQRKVLEKCKEGPFWGMCYAGVEEYISPVISKEVLGFISVSGYKINKEKAFPRIKEVSDNFTLNYKNLLKLYSTLNDNPPESDKLHTLVQPLCYMLRLLYDSAQKIYPGDTIPLNNADYVYSHIITYLNKNYAAKITVTDISKLCHCSNSYINHLFKKRSSKNINDYVNTLRIEDAKKLLLGSQLSISEISEMVGFSDSNYFATVFKKYCNISPLRYRKNM